MVILRGRNSTRENDEKDDRVCGKDETLRGKNGVDVDCVNVVPIL
mgnify:CR=1 FL=1